MKRKIFSIVLLLAMVLTFLPISSPVANAVELAPALTDFDVIGANGRVYVDPPSDTRSLDYPYRYRLSDESGSAPELDSTVLEGYTYSMYTERFDFGACPNGTTKYVQVIKVVDGYIKAWGQKAVTPQPMVEYSGAVDEYGNIDARGLAITLEQGADPSKTKIFLDSDPTTPAAVFDFNNSLRADEEGAYNLSVYSIYGNRVSSNSVTTTSITMNGGCVSGIYGGSGITSSAAIVINGGSCNYIHGTGNSGSETHRADIVINGGNVINIGSAGGAVRVNSVTESTVTINGGFIRKGNDPYEITTFIEGAPPKNSAGNVVEKYILTVKNGGAAVTNTAISLLTTYPELGYTYGLHDVKIDSNGNLLVFLPEGVSTVSVIAGGQTYWGKVTSNKATLMPRSTAPIADVTSIAKTAAVQQSVSYTLTNSPSLSGTCTVYADNTTTAAISTVTAAISGATLTLTDSDGPIEAGSYYVTVTELNKSESTRLQLTVQAAPILINAAAPVITNNLSTTQVEYTKNAAATALDATATVTDGGTISYAWYRNTTSSSAGATSLGVTTATYTPSTAVVGTTYYYCVVTNTNNTVDGNTTAQAISAIANIKVNEADVTPPTVLTLSPANNASGVNRNANLVMTFSEPVVDGDGRIVIHKSSGGPYFETIYLPSAKVTGSGTNTITINPTGIFDSSTTYYVTIEEGAFEDAAGNDYSGIASINIASWRFTTAALSSNADLSALSLSDGTLSPAFSSATTAYTVSVPYATSSIRVTPTTSENTATVKVNNTSVTSGQASGSIALNVGSNAITVEVTAENTSVIRTYTLTVTRASAPTPTPDPDPTPDNTPTPSSTPAPTPAPVIVIINGVEQEAATAETKKVDGKVVTSVIIDDKKTDEKLNAEGNNAKLVIPVKGDSDIKIAQLNGQSVKNMETRDSVLEIKTDHVTYTLPASQINIDKVSDSIGKQIALKDIKVNVQVSSPSQDTMKIVENTASKNSYQVVVKPVEFNIICTSGSKTVEVSKFNGYVERMVAIPEGIDPGKITTGVVLNSDGTFSHVPTTIITIDGKYYAKINSLTNSTYSVISGSKTFKDVEKHWAKNDVNTMASRLVMDGIGTDEFSPNVNITRGELADAVVRGLGLLRSGATTDKFTDVKPGHKYMAAIAIATEYGLIGGYGDNTYRPDNTITREEVMIILARAMKIAGMDVNITDTEAIKILSVYKDASNVNETAVNGAALCTKYRIFEGSNKLLAPGGNITKAETAAVIRRMLVKAKLI